MSERLPARDGESIDRRRSVRFRLDRRSISAFEGDTIGSALAAAGVDITGRSFKYHRPRGMTCMTGSCPNCLMQVDGIPNVRVCTEPVRDGMRVRRQNAWPSADRDIHGWLDRLSFMMPPGFYYKVFQHPRWAWPLVEPFIRSKAGLGRVPRESDHEARERITLHPEVVVVGAGAAGLAAASEAAQAGLDTLVLEQAPQAGGSMRRGPDLSEADRLRDAAESAGARLLTGTAAFGIFEGPLVAAASERALYRVRPRHIVIATGAIEQPAVFPNNDLPGIVLSSMVELLVRRFAVLPGRNAVVMTASEAGHETARTLVEAGATVSVVDLRPDAPAGHGYRVASGTTVLGASGRRRVRSVRIGRPGGEGSEVDCDLLVMAGFTAPSTNLLSMSGAEVGFDERAQAYLPQQLPSHVHAVGAVGGAPSSEAAIAQGRLAGLEIATALGGGAPADAERVDELRAAAAIAGDPVVLPPEVGTGSGKQFACLCMDVTDKELTKAVAEGFDSMELLKRYTTVTMGPCQGKSCMVPSQRLCARATGSSFSETKRTTSRPPWTPVELGALAGARRTPRKETTLHDVHVDADADVMWAGDWRRPHHFTTPEHEVRAVRTRAGVIDVSTLGKFRLVGPQAVDLLERLYPNRFADQPVGRVRYGAMLNDEGLIVDDGAVVRLAEDEFFVTVTSGNTGALERWMTWWLADWRLDVRLLNVTGAYAAVNIAGPASREVMARLTDADISAEALPYLGAAQLDVAGVPALVLRIGFVGELGYEIHFPSMTATDVWERILQAGLEACPPQGIVPFGLEAQRILRLEKQHILIGQDTDAESDPYEVGLGWMVKADKTDFLGKRSLAALEAAGPAERLVGFTSDGPWLPPEGASIVHEGVWVGRVTSARRSEAVGSVIGLAWVPTAWASDGRPLRIEFGSEHADARVALEPFYDPRGERLRS